MGKGEYKIRTFTCAGCGSTVTQRARPKQHYCSLDCYRTNKRPQRMNGEYKICEQCGQTYYVPANRMEQSRFCSFECLNEWQGRNKATCICKICNKMFLRSPSRANATYCSLKCRTADPYWRKQLIHMSAMQQKISPNKLELAGYKILDDLGIEYLAQHLIGDKFCVDAFVPSCGIVIQFDGEYWHGHPDKFPQPDERQSHRMKLDTSQDAYMAACGYTVLRFWESDIHKHPDHVKQVLVSEVLT